VPRADDDYTLWVRRFQPNPESRVRLICLPHAGGSATSYLPFSRSLPPAVEVLAVQGYTKVVLHPAPAAWHTDGAER
jgi:hypothetical protein